MFDPRKQRENWKNWHTYTDKRHNTIDLYSGRYTRRLLWH